MALTIREEIEKRWNESPEFKEAWEESKRLHEEFEKAAKPLVEFLQYNYHPHVKVIVDCEGAELLEGEMVCKFAILGGFEGVEIK